MTLDDLLHRLGDLWINISPWDLTDDRLQIGTLVRVGTPSGEWVTIETQEDFENLPPQMQRNWEDFEEAEGETVFVWDGEMEDNHQTGILVDHNEEEWSIMFADYTKTYHISDPYHFDPDEMYVEPEPDRYFFAVQEKDLPRYQY